MKSGENDVKNGMSVGMCFVPVRVRKRCGVVVDLVHL